jgi:hypothetical protein
MTVATPGSGRVVAIGDSIVSTGPFDDDHIDLLDNKQLALNTVVWLCQPCIGVIPEYPMGTILGMIAMFAALLSFGVVRKRKLINGKLQIR